MNLYDRIPNISTHIYKHLPADLDLDDYSVVYAEQGDTIILEQGAHEEAHTSNEKAAWYRITIAYRPAGGYDLDINYQAALGGGSREPIGGSVERHFTALPWYRIDTVLQQIAAELRTLGVLQHFTDDGQEDAE
ncbi:hypothetical protein M3B43_06720 [Nesterenkonia massiliensis]|uniref:Uncharacterized protein n=1 Tax=Nesterenkonia massiliensis TaxID=1232429 RepID=A0ABT2HR70_9MICC|nr:hypothetical protein [Nesterenkonia massiliensis]MCT1607025.1 hypothetical protein [Nesterenkonia massiliensis]